MAFAAELGGTKREGATQLEIQKEDDWFDQPTRDKGTMGLVRTYCVGGLLRAVVAVVAVALGGARDGDS